MNKIDKEIIDRDIANYLIRAYKLRTKSFSFPDNPNGMSNTDIEIAKMIQKEEHIKEQQSMFYNPLAQLEQMLNRLDK
jgi:hypothetical protein